MEALKDFFPTEWPGSEGKALVSLYRVVRCPLASFGPEPLVLDIGPVRTVVFWATIALPKTIWDTQFIEPGELRFAVQHAPSPPVEGRFCMLAARFSDDLTKPVARAQIEAARGLLCSYHGRNVAYDQRAELALNLSTPQTTFGTPGVENPFALPIPRLSVPERTQFFAATMRLNHPDGFPDGRIQLSCRWFSRAIDESGPDAFLRYWIALEALAMPDSTNVRPIIESLARSYRILYESAASEFLVGRMFGFRSEIVHGGSRRPVPGDVLSYIAAVYIDVLLELFDLPSEGRSREALHATGGVVSTFFGAGSGV
jgi:hypothetical protein